MGHTEHFSFFFLTCSFHRQINGNSTCRYLITSLKCNRTRESRGAEWQLAQRASFINGSDKAPLFCPEFPKQHEKNLTEPPVKKKGTAVVKKKLFKCPKTRTEYPKLIDNMWAAERTHVSVTG